MGLDGLDARCDRLVTLAEADVVQGLERVDDALSVYVRDDARTTAEDGAFAKACDEDIEVRHAVEHWEDGGLRADGGSEVLHGRGERVGLRADENEIEGRGDLAGQQELRLYVEAVLQAGDVEAVAAQLFSARGMDEEGDVAAGSGEASSEVAADGSGADDEGTHKAECRG